VEVNRRQVLVGIGAAAGTAVIGCGGSDGGNAADGAITPPTADAAPPPIDGAPDATPVTACTSR